jgi:protein SCO1/2
LCGLVLAVSALAQSPYGRPLAVRGVGIDQKLNAPIPLDATFTNESGQPVEMRQFFSGKKPVLLSLVYYKCPMLCNMVLNGQASAMKHLGFEAGRDYEAVTISFDPSETPDLAAAKKATYLEKLGQSSAAEGWHFLTGDEKNIKALAEAVGFRYRWDDATKQWAHASAIMILTPDGHLSRYIYGINYAGRDVRLALVDASGGKIGKATDQILLLCYHYDPQQGKYTVAILQTLRLGGMATVALLGAFVWVSVKRERRSRRP